MNLQSPTEKESSFSLGAGALTQLLASIACFLGAFVLPLTFPAFRGISQTILIVLGVVMAVVGVGNIVLGRRIGRLLSRAGRRSRVVVPREGLGYLGIMLTLAVGALLGQQNMPLLVFGLMAGPFILNGWIVYGMLKGISVCRDLPHAAATGELIAVRITASNSKRWLASHLIEVMDQIRGPEHSNLILEREASVTFLRIPAGEQREGRYQIRIQQRGRYQFGPARVSSRYPLGIGERGQLLSDVEQLIIRPRIGRLRPKWKRHQREQAESQRTSNSRPGLFEDEFHRIREYRHDDNPRSIHWRSTARKGELMVREFHQDRRADVFALLDLPELDNWAEDDTERSISLAATLCVEQSRASGAGRYVLGLSQAEPVIVDSRSPIAFRESALDALAVCQRSNESDFGQLVDRLLADHNLHHERLIVISPRPEAVRDQLAAAAARLSERLDLLGRTTIVSAHADELNSIFELEDASRPAERQSPPTEVAR